MKTMKHILLLLAVLTGFASCVKDEDKLYMNSIESGELVATQSAVVLSKANNNDIVLSLAWTKDALQISDPSLKPVDVTIQTIQASLSEDFSGTVIENEESSLSKAYTGKTLNVLARNLGTTPDVVNNIYFRLAAQTGKNMEPVYSNTVKVAVTPYFLDMTIGTILDSSNNATGETLYSPQADGVYAGFIGATSWYNFYMEEGDGTVWGNDGEVGTPFLASSASSKWNFWFPEPQGCYYTVVNTVAKEWTALYIPSLTLAGGLTGDMTFDRKNARWTYVFEAQQTGSITIQVSATGKQYDMSTDTNDDAAKDTPVAFAQSGENLTFGETAGDITVNVPATGECTLIIDLSNPKQWTAEVMQGKIEEEEPEEPDDANPFVYLYGVDDVVSGSWNFNNYLRLYDIYSLGYAGVAYVNSEYGYQIAILDGDWNAVYKMTTGDAYAGTLEYQSVDNIPAPEPGLYFFDISLKNLTYALTAITEDEVYYSGFNDEWNPLSSMAMTKVDTGIYTATVVITKDTPWGFEIVLGDWGVEFGGNDGILLYKKGEVGNIPFDGAPGTYTLTVDLIKGTYTIE